MEFFYAFVIGGAFCAMGQVLIDKTALTPAKILVSFVTAGVIMGALGLYAPIKELGGAGAGRTLALHRQWLPPLQSACSRIITQIKL